eukprot:5779709-Amphidinium_carterae.1
MLSRLRIGSRSANSDTRASGCPRDTKRGAPCFPDITTRSSATTSGRKLVAHRSQRTRKNNPSVQAAPLELIWQIDQYSLKESITCLLFLNRGQAGSGTSRSNTACTPSSGVSFCCTS